MGEPLTMTSASPKMAPTVARMRALPPDERRDRAARLRRRRSGLSEVQVALKRDVAHDAVAVEAARDEELRGRRRRSVTDAGSIEIEIDRRARRAG